MFIEYILQDYKVWGCFMLDYLTKDDLPEGVIDVVDVIGMDAFKSLVKFAGGSNLL